LELGSTDGKLPISLKEKELSMKQSAQRMGQAEYTGYNTWMKVWVAAFAERQGQFIIQGQNCFNQVRDEPLRWETAFVDFLTPCWY
jgi:hypothetical protein